MVKTEIARRVDAILNQDSAKTVSSVQERVRRRLANAGNRVVFCGAGRLGEYALNGWRKAGFQPVAFADNNSGRWNTTLAGIPILSPSEALGQFGQSAVFVTSIYTNSASLEQWRKLGVAPITFAELAWTFPAAFLPHAGLDLPASLLAERDAAGQAARLWADDASVAEYLGQLQFRMTLDRTALPKNEPASSTYFPDDLIRPNPQEVFVDCGAFDGDTLQLFLDHQNGTFGQFHAVEPDPENGRRLRDRLAKLPADCRDRVFIHPYAVGSKRARVTFDATGTAGSAVGSGSLTVDLAPLDEIVAGHPITFVKMDVEGAEPDALLGAKQLITTRKPTLAICLYHAQNHLWSIPLALREWAPDYRLYLRRYSDENWELVCYAVPAERCWRP